MTDQQTPEFDWQEWIERMQGAVDAMYEAMVVRFAPFFDALNAIANDPKFASVFEKYAEEPMTEQTDQPLTDAELAAIEKQLEVLSFVRNPGEVVRFDAQAMNSIGRDVRRLVAEIERLRAEIDKSGHIDTDKIVALLNSGKVHFEMGDGEVSIVPNRIPSLPFRVGDVVRVGANPKTGVIEIVSEKEGCFVVTDTYALWVKPGFLKRVDPSEPPKREEGS